MNTPRGLTPPAERASRMVHAPTRPLPHAMETRKIQPLRHPMREAVVRIARAEIGTREEGGNNCGDRIREYQKATWLASGPWPWCAAFVCWVIREALKDPIVRASMPQIGDPDSWRPLTAGAFDFEKWARTKGLAIKPEVHQARAGDLVIFDFSHIGIVSDDQLGRNISTIEGNTNGRGDRDSVTGDGVWPKSRDYKLTKCYIELAP